MTPLVVGAVLIAGLVLTATVAASAFFLAHRDLVGHCDSVAVAEAAAATTADPDGNPVIDQGRINRRATDGQTETEAITDGTTVVVACTRRVRLPFGALVGAPDGLVRTVVARAGPETR